MIPFFLLPESFQKKIREAEKRREEDEKKFIKFLQKEGLRDWDINFSFSDLNAGYVCFRADTYPYEPLFDVPAVELDQKNLRRPVETDVVYPIPLKENEDPQFQRHWVYRNVILPKGETLGIMKGNRRGKVVFDDDIRMPVLYEWKPWVTWDRPFTIWMSMAPMEMFTQRPGIRHSSGVVAVGGLGLGWFLKQIHDKKSVKKIFLLERSQPLLDWFGYDMCAELPKVQVVKTDAFKYLEKHHESFDKIALDVFETYGNNNIERDYRIYKLLQAGVDPKKLWCWGSCMLGENPEDKGKFWY